MHKISSRFQREDIEIIIHFFGIVSSLIYIYDFHHLHKTFIFSLGYPSICLSKNYFPISLLILFSIAGSAIPVVCPVLLLRCLVLYPVL